MNLRHLVLAGLLSLSALGVVFAERPPQDRKTATDVIVGRVESVEETWSDDTDFYRIGLRVGVVERGQAFQPGDLVIINCFQWTRNWRGQVGAAGHQSIPDEGDSIVAFGRSNGNGFDPTYPDWYDLVESTPNGFFVRVWGYRKFRLFFWLTTIGAGCFVVYRLRRRLNKSIDANAIAAAKVNP